MLQWMGGSRRKVTTSRNSTHKRQKQYFEQKRRQQQTAGLENNADGINTCDQYHEMYKSLDIQSLLNLAKVAEECNSDCPKARESPEFNASPVNYQLSKYPPTGLRNKIIPRGSADLTEAKTNSSDYEVEDVSPKKVFSSGPDNVPFSRNYSSNKNGDRLDHWKTATEHQLSVLDLLGDDGPNGNSEGSPVHEAHVAFSVEGLGKMGMETPVHSPQQPGRNFFNGCSSPTKVARQHHSSKNLKYIMDNLELELNSVIHDTDMPLGGSSLELPFNSRGVKDHSGNSKNTKSTGNGCMPLDAQACQMDNFFSGEECFYNNMEEKNKKPWNARSGFLDYDFLDERAYGVSWKNQPHHMDADSADFLRATIHDVSDFSFEDSYLLNKRPAAKAPIKFDILDASFSEKKSPAPYFKHLASEKDPDFVTLDGTRYPAVNGIWDIKGISNQPTWSNFATEDAKDNTSLLSEESCSSSAVRGEKANNSASNSMKLRESMRKHSNDCCRSQENQYSMKNLYGGETGYKDTVEIHQGKYLKGGKYTRAPNPSSTKPVHHSKELSEVQKNLEPHRSWLFEEGCTPVDIDSELGSFRKTSVESDAASLECKFWSKDLFGAFPVSGLYPNGHSSCKRPKLNVPVECAPSGSFSEKDVNQQPVIHSYDPLVFSNMGSSSRKPDISPASRVEGKLPYSSHVTDSQVDIEFPALSGQENLSKDGEDKSEFRPTDCGKVLNEPDKEVSIGNNDLSSENGKIVDATGSKDNYSECMKAKDETPELIERPKTRDSPDHAEETSLAMKEIPDNLESFINDKKSHFDAHIPFSSQHGRKGKEVSEPKRRIIGSKEHNSSSVEPSYQVMLESYVLQLLCVQKVLKENI